MQTITVQFDPDNPGMAMTVDVPQDNATIRWVKEELCRQDPTGAAQPESFCLYAVSSPGILLDDSVAITPELGTLVLQPHDPEREAREAAARREREEYEREELEMALRLLREEEERKAKEERGQAERRAKKEAAERLDRLTVEGGGPVTEGGPRIYLCAAGALFLKKSTNPRSGKIVKQKREAGSQVFATGRIWTGPSGGVWAELEPSSESSKEESWKQAWGLVGGPGFGLDGPALIDPEDPQAGSESWYEEEAEATQDWPA